MQIDRHRQIVELLNSRGACAVDVLAKEFSVSEMTIRRDLQSLVEDGRIARTHGGAAPVEQVMFEFEFLRRAQENRPSKDLIGRAAAALVEEGQSIILDSGTTTLAIARELQSRRRLTVITTSLPIAAVLQRGSRVEILLLGGFLRRESPDLEGPLTESNLETLRADIAFVGADGIDLSANAYNTSLNVGRLLTKAVKAASTVYVVADSSKLGRTALTKFGNLASWKGLITDSGATPEQLTALRQAGANVIVAQ